MAIFSTIAGSALLGTIANTAVATVGAGLAKKGISAIAGGGKQSSGGSSSSPSPSTGGFNISTTAAGDTSRSYGGPPEARSVNKEEHEAYRDAKMWAQRLDLGEL